MISFTSSGSFDKTFRFLHFMQNYRIDQALHKAGSEGVNALARATPVRTGRADTSWGYEVSRKGGVYEIVWKNSDIEDGFPVAIMLQYGYGTGTGGFVAGRDYINPAIRPIFDQIANEVWKVVTSA
jgi:hypothetical protein